MQKKAKKNRTYQIKVESHGISASGQIIIVITILTSNEKATLRCTSLSQGYIEYTFTDDFW